MSARSIPPDLRDRLDKLFPLLGSDKDGEAAATAAAITRILKAAGFDWHDYVAATKQSVVAISPPWSYPWSRPAPAPAPTRAHHEALDSELVVDLIVQIINRHGRLNARSNDFLDSLEERAGMYETVFFSEKQWTWFMDLAAQAGVDIDDLGDPPY